MISKEQLDSAIDAGVLDQQTANALLAHSQSTPNLKNNVDEEHFQLVSSFNDIFVVIASILLFVSLALIGGKVLGALLVAIAAWGLSEFFVLKRRMAFPAIVFLLYFVGGVFIGILGIVSDQSTPSPNLLHNFLIPCVISIAAAWLHWKRFKVPITVAAGATFVVGAILSASASLIEGNTTVLLTLMSLSGLAVFSLAMYWDASDTKRETRRSDVAFWLHLIAAPLIIHPIFELLGVLNGQSNLFEASVVLALYLAIASVSLIIDRRALMVSALGYVIYVLSTYLTDTNGGVGFVVVPLIIGSALLLLSAFWHKCRTWMLKFIPDNIKNFLAN